MRSPVIENIGVGAHLGSKRTVNLSEQTDLSPITGLPILSI